MTGDGTSCAAWSGELLAGVRGELPGDGQVRLDAHLAGCPGCRREDRQIRELGGLIAGLPMPDPSPDSFEVMLGRIRGAAAERKSRRRALLFLAASLAAAAALLLLFLLPPSLATVEVLHGEVDVAGAVLEGPAALRDGFSLRAVTPARLTISTGRFVELTLREGSVLVGPEVRRLELAAGRAFVRVRPGEGAIRFATPDATVEVAGTAFDLEVGEAGTTVAVVEGVVLAGTGDEPVLRIPGGSAVDFPRGGKPGEPRRIDPRRVRDWCTAPTPVLTASGGNLTFTLRNDTPADLAVMTFDPGAAVYSLVIRGPDGSLPVKVQDFMVKAGRRDPGEPAFRVLGPGREYVLALDLADLALDPGDHAVRAVYRPYPALPPEVWKGDLESGEVVLHVE